VDLDSRRPHLSGPARCVGCQHKWSAVAPIGEVALTCPSCGADKGGRMAMVVPKEAVWTCNCGNVFMLVRVDGMVVCANCGISKHEGTYCE